MDTSMNDGYDLTWLSALLALSGPDAGLHAGEVNTISFHILAELSRVRNPRMLSALEMHLVQGSNRDAACTRYGVNAGNFSRKLAGINRVWQLTEVLRVMDDKSETQTGAGTQ
ncbi:hypothetical protein EWN99_24120 [Salmonella enterica]|nr:hypothetical protein [Salmonella enterica]EBS3177458.1 hypothetical protein [Salmonella enterica subsp. enterica serovar Newport]EBS3869269.1 hypothetical protein [Salmonella enterica subsp. enterica serovar Kimberley]EDL3630014.1 hypothetical protein [Salmonella enterica subsp. enterica serovar Newport]EEE9161485.1 hypothetical protein [Salmonella enterica subsp. enterica serovar Kimberley]